MLPHVSRIISGKPLWKPDMINPRVASGTRTLSDDEFDYSQEDQLAGIVYCPNMLEMSLIPEALGIAAKIKVHDKVAEWVSHINPEVTHNCLTPVICSEMDSRVWIQNVWLFPALVVAHASIRTEAIAVFPWCPKDGGPHITSAQARKGMPIPDDLLFYPSSESGTESLQALQTYEYKTPAAFKRTAFDRLAERYIVPGGQADLAVPFIWPQKNNGVTIDKETKMIAQVYSQMLKYEVNQAMLSSYESTIFLFLRTIEGKKIIYLSPTYQYNDRDTLPAVFSWMCMGLGLVPEDKLHLPKVDLKCVSHRQEMEHGGIVGADLRYMKKFHNDIIGNSRWLRSHRVSLGNKPVNKVNSKKEKE